MSGTGYFDDFGRSTNFQRDIDRWLVTNFQRQALALDALGKPFAATVIW